jgi:peptidoglycan/xylan/chitin deacetylase (PgdA/CDA1 family)
VPPRRGWLTALSDIGHSRRAVLDHVLGDAITIVMYHSVSPAADIYSIRPEAFARQIELLKDHYPIVPLGDIRQHLNRRGRTVIVTFDDAFTDFADTVYPILRQHSVPATVFVPTGFIGAASTWDAHLSHVAAKPIMAADRVRALAEDRLIGIGSHTVDHLSMGGLAVDEMRRQAIASRRRLEELLHRPITMFSYPYGQRCDYSPRSEQILSESGYDVAVTTSWGTRNSAAQLLRLRRIWLRADDTPAVIRAKVEGRYDWIGLKEWTGFALRSALGQVPHET